MRIIFVDEHNSSRQNGIGTYRDILIESLSKSGEVEIVVISLNADVAELTAFSRDYGVEFALPYVNNGNWRDCGDIIWPILSLYITDASDNIVMFNHSPSADFIRAMKEQYPESKSVFVVHDQGWCASLLGQRKLLEKAMCNSPMPFSTAQVETYCKKEIELYNVVDKVVCLSAATEGILHSLYGLPLNRITRIENGINSIKLSINKRKTRSKLGIAPDEKVVLYVGRSAYHKGSPALFNAVEQLVRSNNNIRCVLAGAPQGFVDGLNKHKAIASRVILTGQLSKAELSKWYAIADVGVLSSYTEQCSYAALEMMNAGITIVSSNGNGLDDMFSDGVNAYVAKVDNGRHPKAYARRLAQAIQTAFTAPDGQKRRYAAKNRHLLKTKYSVQTMTKAYLKLFYQLITK